MKVVRGQCATVPHTKNNSKVLEKALAKARAFFNFNIAGIKLNIITNISTICEKFNIKKESIPWYAVGFFKGDEIFVLDKKLFPSRGHEENEFEGVVLHELCHIFIRKAAKKTLVWVSEGLCQYLAFPQTKPGRVACLKKLNNYRDWYKAGGPFSYCSSFFAFLIKKYGKEAILNFLNLLNKYKTEKAFLKAFGVSLLSCEKNFNKLIEKCVFPNYSSLNNLSW